MTFTILLKLLRTFVENNLFKIIQRSIKVPGDMCCLHIEHCLTLVIDFYCGSFEARKRLNNRHQSDLIQYQTGNGLRHASGPVQPIHPLH